MFRLSSDTIFDLLTDLDPFQIQPLQGVFQCIVISLVFTMYYAAKLGELVWLTSVWMFASCL